MAGYDNNLWIIKLEVWSDEKTSGSLAQVLAPLSFELKTKTKI